MGKDPAPSSDPSICATVRDLQRALAETVAETGSNSPPSLDEHAVAAGTSFSELSWAQSTTLARTISQALATTRYLPITSIAGQSRHHSAVQFSEHKDTHTQHCYRVDCGAIPHHTAHTPAEGLPSQHWFQYQLIHTVYQTHQQRWPTVKQQQATTYDTETALIEVVGNTDSVVHDGDRGLVLNLLDTLGLDTPSHTEPKTGPSDPFQLFSSATLTTKDASPISSLTPVAVPILSALTPDDTAIPVGYHRTDFTPISWTTPFQTPLFVTGAVASGKSTTAWNALTRLVETHSLDQTVIVSPIGERPDCAPTPNQEETIHSLETLEELSAPLVSDCLDEYPSSTQVFTTSAPLEVAETGVLQPDQPRPDSERLREVAAEMAASSESSVLFVDDAHWFADHAEVLRDQLRPAVMDTSTAVIVGSGVHELIFPAARTGPIAGDVILHRMLEAPSEPVLDISDSVAKYLVRAQPGSVPGPVCETFYLPAGAALGVPMAITNPHVPKGVLPPVTVLSE